MTGYHNIIVYKSQYLIMHIHFVHELYDVPIYLFIFYFISKMTDGNPVNAKYKLV